MMEKEEKKNGPEGLVAEVTRLVDLVAYQRGSICGVESLRAVAQIIVAIESWLVYCVWQKQQIGDLP